MKKKITLTNNKFTSKYKLEYPRVKHDIEENKLYVTLKEGAGQKKRYLEGRILIEGDEHGVISIEIAPFEI